jgi:hypothetical protein
MKQREDSMSFDENLRLPLFDRETLATLHKLEDKWQHWRTCENRFNEKNIPADQEAAYAAFLENPDDEHQHALVATADRLQVAARYALLRRAYSDLRAKVSAEAGKLLLPLIDKLRAALSVEYRRRLGHDGQETSEEIRKQAVLEIRQAQNAANSAFHRISAADQETGRDDSPLNLASVLLVMNRQ